MKTNEKLEPNFVDKILSKYEGFITKKPYISIIAILIAFAVSLAFIG